MLLLKILALISMVFNVVSRPFGAILTYLLLGMLSYFVCRVDPYAPADWLSGVWHGLFFVPNMFFNWFITSKVHYYSENGTFFYYVWMYLMNLGLFGLFRARR